MRRMSARARAGLAMVLLAAAVALGFVVYSGIQSRVRAATALKRATLEMAAPAVSVVHPKSEAPAEEVVLPGNMQGYVASPVYARVNGYLRKWYFDIGARVRNGQLLAEIDTPEIDRQLDQARADLATAQANYRLAQTTADRYRSLFKSDSVSRQDVEDKVGDLEAKKAVAAKVSADGLTQLQTTEIARAYHDATTADVKRKILETRVFASDTSADIMRRAVARVELDQIKLPKDKITGSKDAEEYSDQEFSKALKEFVDAMQSFRAAAYKMVNLTRHGTYSKAAVRYGIRRINELLGDLKTYKEFLEGVE